MLLLNPFVTTYNIEESKILFRFSLIPLPKKFRKQMGVSSLIRKKAVFLDRDGVINRALIREGLPYPPNSLDELEILPGVTNSLRILKKSGFILVVITNQPDVGRGIQEKETVEKIHAFLLKQLPLDFIYVCWHGKDGDCDCRKPLPGLIYQAERDWNIDLKHSFLIGDRWRDIDAGYAAGCKTVLIDYQYEESLKHQPDYIAKSIIDASEQIIQQSKS